MTPNAVEGGVMFLRGLWHPDPAAAFNAIARIPGVTRVLTRCAQKMLCVQEALSGRSGSRPTALDGIVTLTQLAERSALVSLGVLPGSGVNAGTVAHILKALWTHGVREVHMSGGEWLDSETVSTARLEDMDMGGWKVWRTSEHKVRAVRDAVDLLSEELSNV